MFLNVELCNLKVICRFRPYWRDH